MSVRVKLLLTLLPFALACGGASEPPPPVVGERPATPGGSSPGHEAVQIEGLLGTLSPREIDRGLSPRMPAFMRCFQSRYDHLDVLGGHIRLAFRVHVDGRVRWVFPSASTLGDRDTERCLLEVAAAVRFPPPHGGEAEFSWPLALDPPEDVRPAFGWSADRVADLVASRGREAISACRATASFIVTAYVAPGGRVLAAGASSEDRGASDALECVANQVRGWPMPDPGSYPAKVTFTLR